MKIIPVLRAFVLGFTVTAAALHAQVPQIINYQGRVAVGSPAVNFDGTGSFRFALVNSNGSSTYWSNAPTESVSLAVTKGLYSVLLGDTNLANMAPIPATVFANSDVRLRVWFNDGANGSQLLSPDQRIASVGYAIVAGGLAPGATIAGSQISGTVAKAAVATSLEYGVSVLASRIIGTIQPNQIAPAPAGMVFIPEFSGGIMMGNTVAADTDITDATPVRTEVSDFYIDATEVTRAQWHKVQKWATQVGGYKLSKTNAVTTAEASYPMVDVSWLDCVKWCNARSQLEGKTPVYYANTNYTTVYKTNTGTVFANWAAGGYRLPTEAEWEKAARGGLIEQRFPWGNTISQSQANYYGSTNISYDLGPRGPNMLIDVSLGIDYTVPVGSFAPNAYGLYDMAGNVFEWCWDWYKTTYAGGKDPRGPATGIRRVMRGGSGAQFISAPSIIIYAPGLRCASRSSDDESFRSYDLGFRTVLPASQP